MSLLMELWNHDLPCCYKEAAPDGARIFARLRGCRELRQERHICRTPILESNPSSVGATYLTANHLNGNCAANPMPLLTELENCRNGLLLQRCRPSRGWLPCAFARLQECAPGTPSCKPNQPGRILKAGAPRVNP